MQPASVHAKHSREEIRKWFDAADDNGDGELSIEEFFKWSLHKASQKFGETTLNTVFEKFDKDRSGYLNAWEFEQAATEMGFGGVADHLFKSLDHDCSGTVTYSELIASLQAGTTEVDVETKTLLSSLLWTADVGVKSESNRSLKTAVDEVQGRDVPTVMYELREVLLKHGGQTIDLMKLFDDDATNEYIIDDMEFTKAMRTRFGFKGTKKLLDNVFKAIANGRRAGIGFDEFYEFVRGKKHSFDRRLKLTDDMRLLPPPGTTLDSLVWDVNTLLVLMQQMMARCNIGPMDIMRAWDVDENRQLSKPEFFGHVEALLDGASRDLWASEVAKVAKQAYEHVAALGSGRSSADPRKQIDIVQLERWLNTPCDQPIAVKLRGSRQAMRNPPPTEERKVRPRVDVAAKVRADIEAAAERAARAKEEYLAEERKDLDRFVKSRNSSMPVQRWEVPPQLAPPPHPVFGSQRITLGSLKRWKEDNTKLGSSPEPEFSRTGDAEFALLPWARSLQRSHSHLVSPSASPIGGRKILSNLDVLARKSVSKPLLLLPDLAGRRAGAEGSTRFGVVGADGRSVAQLMRCRGSGQPPPSHGPRGGDDGGAAAAALIDRDEMEDEMMAAPEVEVEKAAELYEMRARKRMDETKETAETEREKLAAALEVAKVAAEEAEEAEKGAGLSASDARKAAEELVRLQLDVDTKEKEKREALEARTAREKAASPACKCSLRRPPSLFPTGPHGSRMRLGISTDRDALAEQVMTSDDDL
ncbi:calcium-dependent protein kinase 17-like protein [Chrysochromulina tobinii]|uniref:Calcium-dependent protein kinase 17-like protein n=1 Tax=Chrysochromulina tobinii TaxID=1460289 RepID=A0A0M0JGK1_9EUKA|nr:calcium-dependent protein kinase 17-like protein [Chrysochromulina tobinii]|eukprot:KOO25580.1 calcium-dependent protein kinase 17-like protein [Chrysochromulina sp. CCMP291]